MEVFLVKSGATQSSGAGWGMHVLLAEKPLS